MRIVIPEYEIIDQGSAGIHVNEIGSVHLTRTIRGKYLSITIGEMVYKVDPEDMMKALKVLFDK